MVLNNNWSRNIDTGKWSPTKDTLSKTDFDSLSQDLKTLRFYQKCLSGSTYVSVNQPINGTQSSSIEDVYDILGHYSHKSYLFDGVNLQYLDPFTASYPNDFSVISTTSSLSEFNDKISLDYGLTLKNLFTPERLIKDHKQNLFYVDVATTDIINNLSDSKVGLTIDGVRLKEGQRVLVKDQYDLVTTLLDPSTFFYGHYELTSGTTYKIPNSDNGIYVFQNKKLVRTNELDSYGESIRYSVCVKSGDINREKQFKLNRLASGLYPLWNSGNLYPLGPVGESMYFDESHNFVLRNRVDYNNLYELSLQDTLKHGTQSIVVTTSSGTSSYVATYSIPERTIVVGEFGVIINHQENITNIIDSKYKSTLRSISENSRYYWVCGDNGTLLKVDKIDFSISLVSLKVQNFNINQSSDKVLTTLNSVSFFNNLMGVVVGDFNQIWFTNDGGETWTQIYLSDFDSYNYNKVLFTNIDTFYIGGDNGVFIEFNYNLGDWIAHKRRISKYVNGLDDEYLLLDDIKDMNFFTVGTNSYISICGELNAIYLYDINQYLTGTYSFLYLQDTNFIDFGDLNALTYVNATNSLFISNFENIYQLNPIDGILIGTNSNIFSTTFSLFYTQSAINTMNSHLDQIVYAGNFSLWKFISPTQSSDVYDPTFFDRLKPRMLFLDYDIGSKLYWFDDYGQYRIPSRVEIPFSYLQGIGTNSQFGFNRNNNTVYDANLSLTYTYSETNWISYFKDRQKTFEYYSNLEQLYIIEPSFTFSSSDALGTTYSYTTVSVTTNYNDIAGLMPNATPPNQLSTITQSSRFREITGVTISTPTTPYDLYFYDYLGIWHLSLNIGDIGPEKGDVININSDIFNGNFIINKVITETNITSQSPAYTQINFNNGWTGYDVEVTYGTYSLGITQSTTSNPSTLAQYLVNDINSKTSLTGFSALYIPTTGVKIYAPLLPTPTYYNGQQLTLLLDNGTASHSPIFTLSGATYVATEEIYCYFYTDFNQNILNNIPQSLTGFTIRDLNKYPLTNGDNQYIVDNLNLHYLSYSYNTELGPTSSFIITPKYSQWSAYYNLQSKIDVIDITSTTYSVDIRYASGFLNFGYSPTYNLLSYLNFLNPIEFVPTKEFWSIPNYIDVPGPQLVPGATNSQVYVDITYPTNKLNIGKDLKHIWDSYPKWIFIDLDVIDNLSNVITTERLLIVDKYYDSNNDWYVIEFHDKINFSLGVDIYYFNFKARRTLQKISDDLQYINRLHRPDWLESSSYLPDMNYGELQTDGTFAGPRGISIAGTWSNWETKIDFKVPTDSYTKILLSDSSIIKSLSALIYTDYKYELAMQVTKLNELYNYDVNSVIQNGGFYQLDFIDKHNLNDKDYVVISSYTQSGYPDNILGYHNIEKVSDYSIKLPISYSGPFSPIGLQIEFVKKDNFFNFQPIDIFDLGIGDKKIKQSVEVTTEQYEIVGKRYNLINLDINKYKFRLIDGLDLETLNSLFPWVLEAEISDAVIGLDGSGNLNWYKGVWYCGRWFGGNWISGYWLSGDWYSGNWTSKSITNNILSVKVDNQNTNTHSSLWYGGRWFDGNWENGTWYDGRWYGGTHYNGRWFNGTWNDGIWVNGIFQGGIWVLGQWDYGRFNTDNSMSYWLDGKFCGGDFENGVWYNGIFDQKNNRISRFGTRSNNTRNSIWKSGKLLKGEFHSYLNINDSGNPDVSEIHKYSKWMTGIFNGDFWGGIAYNINFKNGIWHGGILKDIEVVYIDSPLSQITLSGEWEFNVNDEFYILDNMNSGTFSVYGSTITPMGYKVLRVNYDVNQDETTVNTNVNLNNISNISGTVSNLRCVSIFENSTWLSGLWYNGVFKDGTFNGGMWQNGYFEGNWG